MPLSLNTTLTDAYANSYVDQTYCDSYWQNHFNASKAAQWAALSAGQKTTLLIAACRVIETARFTVAVRLRDGYPLFYDRRTHVVAQLNDQILPVKYYFYQRLQFPRNLDRDINTGALFIPEPIMTAQCEQAVYLLNYDDTAIANRLSGVVEDVTYVGNIHLRQNYVSDGSSFAPSALEMIRPYLLKTSYEVRRQ